MALIELSGVAKTYPMPGEDVHALRSVEVAIDPGELVSVVGSSGSGKTTLLYLLGMLTDATTGSYRFDGRSVDGLTDRERSDLRGREIGFVFQSFHLLPQVDVLGNVLLSERYRRDRGEARARRERARRLLESVGLGHRLSHRPRELSGGEMQRVAIARALLSEPRVILADEPTGNLDESNGGQVFAFLEDLADKGHTVVLVTHDLALAARTPRRIQLRDGAIVDDSRTAA